MKFTEVTTEQLDRARSEIAALQERLGSSLPDRPLEQIKDMKTTVKDIIQSLKESLKVKLQQLQPEEPEPTETPVSGEPSESPEIEEPEPTELPFSGEPSEAPVTESNAAEEEEEQKRESNLFSRILSDRRRRRMKQILKHGRSSLWKLWKKSRGLHSLKSQP